MRGHTQSASGRGPGGCDRRFPSHVRTVDTTEQTYEIAARLNRGEALYAEEA